MDTRNIPLESAGAATLLPSSLATTTASAPTVDPFQQIFEQAPVALLHLDLAGVIRIANQRCCDLLGITAAELCGTSFAEWEYIADAVGTPRRWEPATVSTAPVELQLRRSLDIFIWVRVTATVARDPAGTPTGILLALADLQTEHLAQTEARRVDQQMAHRIEDLATIFELLPIGLAIASTPDCAMITANTHFERILRLPPQSNISPNGDRAPLPFQIQRNGRPLDPTELPMHFAAAHDVAVNAEEYDIVHPDGVTHHLFGYAIPLHASDGSVRGAVGAFMDISAHLRLERQAQQRAATLDAALESSADGVALHDSHGKLVRVNSALRTLLGLDNVPDLAHLTLAERGALLQVTDVAGDELLDELRPAYRTLNGDVLAGDQTLDVSVHTLDGRDLYLNISGAPVRDAAGTITGSVLIYRDVTSRHKLEAAILEQVNQKDAVLDALTDGLVVYDTQQRILHANPAARALLSLDERPLLSHLTFAEWVECIRPRDMQGQPVALADLPVSRILAGARLIGAKASELRVRRVGGGEVTVSVTGAPIFDAGGQISGAVCVFRDISAQVKQDRERWDMLNIVAHELKTPVTSMMLLAHVVQRRLRKIQHPEVDNLNKIIHEIDRVTRLISDLGEAARMEHGKLTLILNTCNLGQICQDAAQEQARVSGRHVAVIAPADPILLQADTLRIRQILTNLLNNACKYTPEDAALSLALIPADRHVVVEVRDTGPGIPDEALAHLFDRFYRVPNVLGNTSHVSMGLGLGLAICKALVEAHGGRIGVTSHLGEGTTFRFTLPLTPPAPQ